MHRAPPPGLAARGLAAAHRLPPSLPRSTSPLSPWACPPAVKEVRNSAFVSALKERMAQLRHSKLYKQVGLAAWGWVPALGGLARGLCILA